MKSRLMILTWCLCTTYGFAEDPSKKTTDQKLKVHQQATTVSKEVKPSTVVCRSAKELKKALGTDAAVMKKLKPVDFSKQMAIVIRNGKVNAFGVQLTILKAIAADKDALIEWQYKPYFGGAAPPDQPGNPTLVAVLDKAPGKVTFKKTIWQYPKGQPLPPSAPPRRP